MRTPITARQCAEKTFYVFFAFGGKYSGCYSTIIERSEEKARYRALAQYGIGNFHSVTADEERAKAKIRAFNLQQI